MKRELPKYIYRKGKKGYLYFTSDQKTQRMHEEPGTPAFATEYARLLNGSPSAPRKQTWAALIKSYRQSDRFVTKALRTRSDYDKVLTYLRDKLGDLDPSKMRRKDVIRVRDANRDSVRFANYCTQVMSVCLEHAIDIGWRDDNCARGVRSLKSNTPPRRPWPAELIAAYRAEASGQALLVFELCLGTGQRIGDVLRMRWGDLDGDAIRVVQGKTGRELWVPLTPQLMAALARTPRTGLTILTGTGSKPWSYRTAADAVMRIRKKIGAEAYDIHALRHTAAAELAAAGCSDELIQAVTGHATGAMVALYSQAARQKARAIQAQEKRK